MSDNSSDDVPGGPDAPSNLDVRALMQEMYGHVRALARRHLESERANHSLGATEVVHEVLIKLLGPRKMPWAGQGHFYRAAADAVRQVLIDHARSRKRLKRGGGAAPVVLRESAVLAGEASPGDGIDHVALDRAFHRLSERDPRAAEVVRLRYYAGIDVAETALVLGVSERTVKSDWAFARAWLERELQRAGSESQEGSTR